MDIFSESPSRLRAEHLESAPSQSPLGTGGASASGRVRHSPPMLFWDALPHAYAADSGAIALWWSQVSPISGARITENGDWSVTETEDEVIAV